MPGRQSGAKLAEMLFDIIISGRYKLATRLASRFALCACAYVFEQARVCALRTRLTSTNCCRVLPRHAKRHCPKVVCEAEQQQQQRYAPLIQMLESVESTLDRSGPVWLVRFVTIVITKTARLDHLFEFSPSYNACLQRASFPCERKLSMLTEWRRVLKSVRGSIALLNALYCTQTRRLNDNRKTHTNTQTHSFHAAYAMCCTPANTPVCAIVICAAAAAAAAAMPVSVHLRCVVTLLNGVCLYVCVIRSKRWIAGSAA